MPVGARVVFSAQAKAGKSTIRDNLIRCLADGDPFLDHFPVTPPPGRILVVDVELHRSMLRAWLRDQGIKNEDGVVVLALRGRVRDFDILTPAGQAQWAQVLQDLDVSFVILDCLRPVLDAFGLSEDKDAGQFFVAFDALLEQAGVSEGVIVHHMGHDGQRSRGDTRIRDWPDAEWGLSKKGQNGPRHFWANGRDVDLPKTSLSYDPSRRHVSAEGPTTGSPAKPSTGIRRSGRSCKRRPG